MVSIVQKPKMLPPNPNIQISFLKNFVSTENFKIKFSLYVKHKLPQDIKLLSHENSHILFIILHASFELTSIRFENRMLLTHSR